MPHSIPGPRRPNSLIQPPLIRLNIVTRIPILAVLANSHSITPGCYPSASAQLTRTPNIYSNLRISSRNEIDNDLV